MLRIPASHSHSTKLFPLTQCREPKDTRSLSPSSEVHGVVGSRHWIKPLPDSQLPTTESLSKLENCFVRNPKRGHFLTLLTFSSILKLCLATVLPVTFTAVIVLSSSSAGWTKEKKEADQFPPSPLEITTPDPLLPRPSVDRPFSPLEINELRAALDQLNAQATAQLNAGNPAGAFEIWYRELRLRRALGALEEVNALGRVGEIAWQNNRKEDVQIITKRLRAIQLEVQAKPPVDGALLQALGTAYQQIREPRAALEIYQQILADARQRQEQETEEATLKTIAELHMAWFEYPQAAATYEELLTRATARGDRFNEVVYLQQLAYIYEKAKQPENSLRMKEQLAQSYLNQKDFTNLPALKIAIAADHEAIGKAEEQRKNTDKAFEHYELASQNYQEAYSLAFSLQQFAYASEALDKMGTLYRSNQQLDYALQVYQVKIQVDQQSYNYYSLMNTYDQIGQIYSEQKNYPQAIEAYQKGLELAKSLKYQETYFATQIQRVKATGD